MASDSTQQILTPGGAGLLGNVLTQGGIPRGGGIIRDLTKVFSKSPPCPRVGQGFLRLMHKNMFCC